MEFETDPQFKELLKSEFDIILEEFDIILEELEYDVIRDASTKDDVTYPPSEKPRKIGKRRALCDMSTYVPKKKRKIVDPNYYKGQLDETNLNAIKMATEYFNKNYRWGGQKLKLKELQKDINENVLMPNGYPIWKRANIGWHTFCDNNYLTPDVYCVKKIINKSRT